MNIIVIDDTPTLLISYFCVVYLNNFKRHKETFESFFCINVSLNVLMFCV